MLKSSSSQTYQLCVLSPRATTSKTLRKHRVSELRQTEQWLRERCGKFTASRAHEIMAKIKSGAPSAMRANYLADLVCQRITGEPGTSFVTPEMQYGIDTEEEACATYCLEKS